MGGATGESILGPDGGRTLRLAGGSGCRWFVFPAAGTVGNMTTHEARAGRRSESLSRRSSPYALGVAAGMTAALLARGQGYKLK